MSKIDFKALTEQYKDLIDFLGPCPLSCYDLIEALQTGDCMSLCLDIGRSEAAIADPSRLVIKDIIPTFMASDSFLDSASFSIGRDEEAHGGFKVSTTGKLAMGLGRENITGIMPLYLFKEHWEIARRKAPPIFGFMCTLDVMGYASSQYFTIPYLVLLECMKKNADEGGKEIFKRIEKLVLDTCVHIIKMHEEFRKNVINQIKEFAKSPEQRTADIVPSIQIMIAQLYCLMQLDNYQELVGEDLILN